MEANLNKSQYYNLLVGTYSTDDGEDILVYRFDSQTGNATYLNGIKGINNPSYLCISRNGRFVYAVNENDHDKHGDVTALAYEPATGTLRVINQQSTGHGPCYISVDAHQRHAFVANYAGGSMAVFPIDENGALLPMCQAIQKHGSGPDPERQEQPHVHACPLSPDEKYLLFTDLGTDQVHFYRYRPDDPQPLGTATPNSIHVNPGDGPRHIAFSPDSEWMHLVTEMGGCIYVYRYDGPQSQQVQRISLVPADFNGKNGGADLHVSPDGHFLYASNRGDANEIVVFSIDTATGELTFVERKSSIGQSPRSIALDPTGSFLLVANENSDDVYIYAIDKQTGKLTLTHVKINIGKPCCLKFTAAE